jgi:hypothetical protein
MENKKITIIGTKKDATLNVEVALNQPDLAIASIGTLFALSDKGFALGMLIHKEDGRKVLFALENGEAQDYGFVVHKPFETKWQAGEVVYRCEDSTLEELEPLLTLPVSEKEFKDVAIGSVFLSEGALWQKTAPAPHKGKEGWAYRLTGESDEFDRFEKRQTVYPLDPECCTVR